MQKMIAKFADLFGNKSSRALMLNEIKSLWSLKAYWFSFYFITTIIWLSAAFDSDRIGSLSDRAVFVFSATTMAALGSSVVAGIWSAASGRSVLEHVDILPKAILIWLLIATIPARLVLLTMTGGSFNMSELVNGAIHGLSISCIIVLTFAVTHFGPKAILKHMGADGTTGAKEAKPIKINVPFYIEAEDHYVKLVSSRGVEIVRARLSDIEEEFCETGMRCHKSYWVSYSAISHKGRTGRQLRLVLNCGTEIPVGRSYEKAVLAQLLTLGRGDLYMHTAD